jgi:ribosomal protein S6--L-glutamate ligase
MAWVSFDVFRTLGFQDTLQLKPDQLFSRKEDISHADWVLFAEHWQLNALIYGLKARVFPSEASYRLGHDKIEMTRAFEVVAPVNTPHTRIAPNTPRHAEDLWQEMGLPFVAKLPKASQGNGVWLITDHRQWRDYLNSTDILYVQEYLPIDRDVRVIVVGTEVVSAYWRCQSERGFYNNIAQGGTVDYSPVPVQVTDLALHLARSLDINHAGFDIALVEGHPYVLEFNRLFGNQGIPGGDARLRDAIVRYLNSHGELTGPDTPDKPATGKRLKRLRRVA